jgi:hypothetical protein
MYKQLRRDKMETPPLIKKSKKPYVATPQKQEYFRNYKRKERVTNKKCSRCGAQATIKVLLTQELLCDKEDVERLKNKYKKKEKTNDVSTPQN